MQSISISDPQLPQQGRISHASGRVNRAVTKQPQIHPSARPTPNFSSDRLGDDGGGGRGLVAPGGGEDTDGLVVAGKTVDTRLDENEAELGVLVLAVALKVLADSDGLIHLVRLM